MIGNEEYSDKLAASRENVTLSDDVPLVDNQQLEHDNKGTADVVEVISTIFFPVEECNRVFP